MHPTVDKVDFHAVDVVHLLVFVKLLHFFENGIHVGRRLQVDAVFRHEIAGIGLAKFAHLHALLCELRQEKGDAHECVAPIVRGGIDDSAIAFAANHCVYVFHERGDIHLAHRRGTIFAAVLGRDVTQRTGRGKVRNGVARCVRKHVVGHADERVFLTKHLAIFTDESESVNIGINHDSEVKTTFFNLVHDATEVLLQRLGIVGEVAVGLAVEELRLHAECLQQVGQDDAANGVDAIYHHAETSLSDGFGIDQL